jgi:hypothetical protein
VVLLETGANTGLFSPQLPLYTGGGVAVPYDGVLQTTLGSVVIGYYVDPDVPLDQCYTGALVLPAGREGGLLQKIKR